MNFSKKWIRFFDLPLAKQDEIRQELTLPDTPIQVDETTCRVSLRSSGFLELVKRGHEAHMLFAYDDEKIIAWLAKIKVVGLCNVLMFFTRPSYRRQGIAKKLSVIAAGLITDGAMIHGWDEASMALQNSVQNSVQNMFTVDRSIISTIPTHQL